MKGTWEELPASPCSGASCEHDMRSSFKPSSDPSPLVTIHPTASSVQVDLTRDCTSLPITKRARVDYADSPSAHRVSIEFVEPPLTTAGSHSDFVSRLNDGAGDDRRTKLMERLRAIGNKKAQLGAVPCNPDGSGVDDDVILVAEKPLGKRSRGRAPTRQSTRRKAPTKRASKGTTKGPAKPIAQQVIDVDNDTAPVKPLTTPTGKVSARGKISSNSKSKKSSGNTSAFAVEPKRVSSRVRRPRNPIGMRDEAENRPAPMPTCMSKCKRLQFSKRLINAMMREPSTGPFSAPVVELWPEQAIPRYFEYIKQPMDLRTVKRNLETNIYLHPTPGEYLPYQFDVDLFANDVRQIFENARIYNKRGDALHNAATLLLEDFQRTIREQLPAPPSPEEIAAMLSKKRSHSGRSRKEKESNGSSRKKAISGEMASPKKSCGGETGTPKTPRRSKAPAARQSFDPAEIESMSGKELRSRLRYLQECRTPVIARAPIPKGSGYLSRAALLYDVDITWQEKNRMKDSIEKVPANKLEALISMIRKASSEGVSEEKNECIEFDMDNLGNTALRNIEAFLEEFVPGFKTVRNSTLGREFVSVSQLDDEIAAIRTRLSEATKEKRAVVEPIKVADKPKSFFQATNSGEYSSSDSSSSGESDSCSDSSDDSDTE